MSMVTKGWFGLSPRWIVAGLVAAVIFVAVSRSEKGSKNNLEVGRSYLLAAMKPDPSNQVTKWLAESVLRYGYYEDTASVNFGPPLSDQRDGRGNHTKLWAGNGVVVMATFQNGQCIAYSILDEKDVRAMKFDKE